MAKDKEKVKDRTKKAAEQEEARELLPALAARLAQGPGAAWRIDWLTGE